MRRKRRNKLALNKETLKNLDAENLRGVAGGAAPQSATDGQNVCCSLLTDACNPVTCFPGGGPCWCPP